MGISGSGKSKIVQQYKESDFIAVCPDELRKELTGDINNQSKNFEVFQTAYRITRSFLEKKQPVIFDSTAINPKTRKDLLKIAEETGSQAILLVLTDSQDMELCYNRIAKDIASKRDRSNVPKEIVMRQHQQFMEAMNVIDSENWDSILYLQ